MASAKTSPVNTTKKATTSETIADTAKSVQRMATEKANDAARASTELLDANPFGAIAGVIAAGAVAAALIPTSRREIETLGPLAGKLRHAIEEAVEAAKLAGSNELTAAGLTVAAASDGLGGVVGKVVKAAGVSASAAAASVKQARTAQPTTPNPMSALQPSTAMATDMSDAPRPLDA